MYVPWRENSSASAFQPLRRFSSFQTKKRTFTAGRRYSCDTKMPISHLSPTLLSSKLNGSPSPHHTSTMFTSRGQTWQSQVEDTIDEDVETNSSIVLTYRPKYGMISRSVVITCYQFNYMEVEAASESNSKLQYFWVSNSCN